MHKSRVAVLMVVGAAMMACSESPTDNTTPSGPLFLSVVSGNDQTALPGADLPNPLVVVVEDALGRKVRGQIVNFRVVAGGGNVFAGAAITNADGIAKERWTLGSSGAQRVEARAVDVETGSAITFATFTATLTVSEPANLSISPSSHNFGVVQVGGSSAVREFTISNSGRSTSPQITATTGLPTSFKVANHCTTLAAGASCTVAVTFTPTVAGEKIDKLMISQGSAAGNGTPTGTLLSAVITGTGAATGLQASPDNISFTGVSINSSATKEVTVTNESNSASGTITTVFSGPDASAFSLGTTTCGPPIPARGKCTLPVRFAPTSAGSKTATLRITDAATGTVQVALSGTPGLTNSATLTLSANSTTDFGTVAVGSKSAVLTFTVKNGGGGASGPVKVQFASGGQHYTFVANSCSAALAPGGFCSFDLQLTPKEVSNANTMLEAIASPGGTPSLSIQGRIVASSPGPAKTRD